MNLFELLHDKLKEGGVDPMAKMVGLNLRRFNTKDMEDPKKKAWANSGASEFNRIKKMILLIEGKQDHLAMLKKKVQTPMNAEELFRAKMKVTMEIRVLEEDLIKNAQNKFRYIRGHEKEEIRPGLMQEEAKFKKNITNRIIKPCDRVAHCQRTARALHMDTQRF
jgi:hypothetical protein